MLSLLHGVNTNHTQYLGRVNQLLQENFEVLFHEQGDIASTVSIRITVGLELLLYL